MTRPVTAPTPEQFAALERFKATFGRTWKTQLAALWLTGADDRGPDGPYLRQLRNQCGPSWLATQ